MCDRQVLHIDPPYECCGGMGGWQNCTVKCFEWSSSNINTDLPDLLYRPFVKPFRGLTRVRLDSVTIIVYYLISIHTIFGGKRRSTQKTFPTGDTRQDITTNQLPPTNKPSVLLECMTRAGNWTPGHWGSPCAVYILSAFNPVCCGWCGLLLQRHRSSHRHKMDPNTLLERGHRFNNKKAQPFTEVLRVVKPQWQLYNSLPPNIPPSWAAGSEFVSTISRQRMQVSNNTSFPQ